MFTQYFEQKHGLADSEYLTAYLELCETACNDLDSAAELHHILPRTTFPEYADLQKNPWNGVLLTRKDHARAHALLFGAYPIREYQRPLTFMGWKNTFTAEDYKRKISESAIRGWKKLKSDPQKYANWAAKRSEYMRAQMKPGMPLFDLLQTKEMSAEHRKKNAETLKRFWTAPEYAEIRQKRIDYLKSDEHRLKLKSMLAARYSDTEFMEKFTAKMTDVNQSPEKRAKAGNSLKRRWQDPEYRAKVLAARTGKKRGPYKRKQTDET